MPNLDTLTEADVRQWLPGSVRQGAKYVKRVQHPARAGETLSAQVIGGRVYEVEVTVQASGIASRCQCSWGGNCKHVAGVLLKWVQSPSSFGSAVPPKLVRDHELEVILVEPLKTHRPKDLPWWVRASFDDRRQVERQQLEQWLSSTSLQVLRALAKNLGWPIKGNNKQAVVGQVSQQMTSPDNILRALHDLDADHQRVLYAMVVGHGRVVKPEDLERVALAWGAWPRHGRVDPMVDDLRQAGLVVFGQSSPYRSEYLVPNAVARHLVPALDSRVRDSQPQSREPVLPQLADPYVFIQAVNQVALLLDQSSVALRPPMPRPHMEKFHPALQSWDYDPAEIGQLKTNRQLQSHGYLNVPLTVPPPRPALSDDALERFAPLAGSGGYNPVGATPAARLEFIYALLVAAGLFQPGSPVTAWREVQERYLRLDEMGQRAILANSYMTMSNWSEVWDVARANGLALKRVAGYGDQKPANLQSDLTNFRLVVLRVLACLPDDQWIALDEVFPVLRALLPRFDGASWSYYGPAHPLWYLAKAGSDKLVDTQVAANWDLVQGNFIRQIIAGPLHWLGLADLGLARKNKDELAAFRLHGLGDLFWDRSEAPPALQHVALPMADARTPGQTLETDGLAITVNPAAIKAQAHGLLERVARLEAAKAERFVYRLDAQAVFRAFEAGHVLADILNDWERLLPVPMPEAIREQLTQWWAAYGRVRIYENLTVIELGDDYALAEIRSVTGLAQHLIAEISPRLVIVNQDAVPTLMAELEKAGYTPKQTSDV